VVVSHRPAGAMEWKDGPPPQDDRNDSPMIDRNTKQRRQDGDTGTYHPHGTKYKPQMVKYHNVGKSRRTGHEYSTTVIEALGVEHKETTRNYDILAAVFTEALKYMHDDFRIV